MIKFLKIIIIIVVIIGGISLAISYYLGKQKVEKSELTEIQKIYQAQSQKQATEKEFISPKNQLKLTYPSSWVKVKDEEMKKRFSSDQWEVLFLAQRMVLNQFFQLSVRTAEVGEQNNFGKIIKMIRQTTQREGWKMQIEDKQQKEKNILRAEVRYTKSGHRDLHSNLKLLLEEKGRKVYVVEIVGPDEDWKTVQDEADAILASVQLIK